MIFTANVLDWQHAILDNHNPVSSDVWKQSTALLKICRQNHIRATFFLQDNVVTKYPLLVRRIISEGHEVGCLFQLSKSTNNLEINITRAIKQLRNTADQPIHASRALNINRNNIETYCYTLNNNKILYDSSLFSAKNSHPFGNNRLKLTRYFDLYNIQQYPQAALLNIPLTNKYLISFGNKSFRLLPYFINRLFNLNKNPNDCIFTITSYDLPSKALDNIKDSYSISLKDQLDFIGRRNIPLKLVKLLRDYPFTSLAEYYEDHTPQKISKKIL